MCRTRCRADIDAFETANANPTIISQTYTTRSASPFFVSLDEGAVTPMTIIAITEISDCVFVCGARLPSEALLSPDQCVAIAGTTGDSDLTMATYCVPSKPGAGVRRGAVWTIPGTLSIMNSVIDAAFVDFARGETVVLLREVEIDTSTNYFHSRIDAFKRGDEFSGDLLWAPLADADTFLPHFDLEASASLTLQRITGILVQPGSTATAGFPVLYAEVTAVKVTNIPSSSSDFGEMDDEKATSKTYNLCGYLSSGGKVWSGMSSTCSTELWDEASRGHIIWITPELAVVLPGGSMMSTNTGNVRIIRFEAMSSQKPVALGNRPFKSSSWMLTSGIPPISRGLDFSITTRSLVRKTAMVSQTGVGMFVNAASNIPHKVQTFMSNDPTAPTHWLSQNRLDIPLEGTAGDASASSFQGIEITKTYELRQKCNYQVLCLLET